MYSQLQIERILTSLNIHTFRSGSVLLTHCVFSTRSLYSVCMKRLTWVSVHRCSQLAHIFQVVLHNKQDKSEVEFPIYRNLSLESQGMDIAVEVPVKGQDWPGKL